MTHVHGRAFAALVALVVGVLAVPVGVAHAGAGTRAGGATPPWHVPLSAYRDAPPATGPATAARRGATTMSITPTDGNTDTRFTGSGSGFTPNATVSITVTQNGQPYTGGYTKTRSTDATGTFTFAWIWTAPDPLGTYTYGATDAAGHSAQVTFTIAQSTGPPAPEAGSSLMFDTASAPDQATMDAWLAASPYRSVGVYVPVDPTVDDRHDKAQADLTSSWVSTNTANGWSVVPIYLGLQAPASCSSYDFHHMSESPATAEQQGLAAAQDAASSVAALGIPTSVPVVYDMEPYTAGGCTAQVAAFLGGWTVGLHQAGRSSAVYGTQTTAMADLDAQRDVAGYHQPDVVWVASDSRMATTTGFTHPADGTFVGERMNQFRLDVERTYGGVTLEVDESAVNDGVLHGTPPPPVPTVSARAVPSVSLASPTVSWAGAVSDGCAPTYDVRTETGTYRKPLSGWSYPHALQGTSSTSTRLALARGGTTCFSVRAHGAGGGVSGWTTPRCTTSPVDDRSLSGTGWHRQRQADAYRNTLTTTTRRGGVLRLTHVRAQRVGVLLSGTRGAKVVVELDGRRLGVLTVGRRPSTAFTQRVSTRSGTLTLTSLTRKEVALDGVVVASGA